MKSLCLIAVACTTLVIVPPDTVSGQTGRPGGHVHYRDQNGQQASPTGALAPRLQIALENNPAASALIRRRRRGSS